MIKLKYLIYEFKYNQEYIIDRCILCLKSIEKLYDVVFEKLKRSEYINYYGCRVREIDQVVGLQVDIDLLNKGQMSYDILSYLEALLNGEGISLVVDVVDNYYTIDFIILDDTIQTYKINSTKSELLNRILKGIYGEIMRRLLNLQEELL